MKTDILSTIVENKRIEIELQMQVTSADDLRALIAQKAPCRSMSKSLVQSPVGIIAEFKRRSPSKGWIHRDAQPLEVVPGYEQAGAAALSILTDEKFFGGTLADIEQVRNATNLPILRKDFTISEYQLLQARAVGADAVLLIAACLTQERCRELTLQAHELGLEVLLEIHDAAELDYINPEVDMVGINNRHLGTFVTDVAQSFELAEALKERVAQQGRETGPALVSESGLSQPATVARLHAAGFRGFLMGEAFMKTAQPAETLSRFYQDTLQILH